MVDFMPLCNKCFVVSPVDTHDTECLPERRRRKTLVAGQQPHLKQHRKYSLTQVIANIICNTNIFYKTSLFIIYLF